jgi:redox-sensitive bicupin YhaK (pirin superfamily)
MIQIRKSDERGATRLDWLNSKHTFSFADYHDPDHIGFGPVRVINEDRVLPHGSFPTHSHKDMEIVSYPLSGQLEHQDSMGNSSIIRRGDVQKMSAGTGVQHSESNPSDNQSNHFFQIWIVPDTIGLEPSYEQIDVPDPDEGGGLTCIGSKGGTKGGVTIHQDVDLYLVRLASEASNRYRLIPGRRAWVQVAWGMLTCNYEPLTAGDGAALEDEASVWFTAKTDTEALLFDVG